MKWYKLVFKQNQPIHIGSTKWGIVNKTEIFIPGWTMWGALTKTFNQYSKESKLSENQKLFETITCFYPSFDEEGRNILFPNYKNGLLYLGEYSEDKFRYEFTDTFVSTAIIPGLRSAKEESLHEIEILLPESKKDSKKDSKKEKKQLYWVGILGINEKLLSDNSDNKDLNKDLFNFLEEGLKNIYIGGDVKYGFGELELIRPPNNNNVLKLKELDINDLKRWNIDNNGYLTLEDNKNIKQFLEFSPEIKFEGELKLLAEFDFTKNTPEIKKIKEVDYSINAGYFINIGSKINSKIPNLSFKLVKGKFEKVCL